MTLTDHFTYHVTSDLAATRTAIIASVLSDPAALRELEESRELWLDLPVAALAESLYQLFRLRQHDDTAAAFMARQEQVNIGRSVEALYMGAINTWLDAELAEVDLDQLGESENIPEPDNAA